MVIFRLQWTEMALVDLRQEFDLPCLVQLLTWLNVSDYRNFWNTNTKMESSN